MPSLSPQGDLVSVHQPEILERHNKYENPPRCGFFLSARIKVQVVLVTYKAFHDEVIPLLLSHIPLPLSVPVPIPADLLFAEHSTLPPQDFAPLCPI